MMVEARHWQERAASVADGTPLDRALVRYMFGGSLAMDGRPDLGLPLIAAGHDAVRGTPDEHAPLRGEVLAILSGALFVAEQDEAGRANTADVREIAAATPDGSLDLLADLSTLLSGAGTAEPEQVIDRASAVYDDAVAGDNSIRGMDGVGGGRERRPGGRRRRERTALVGPDGVAAPRAAGPRRPDAARAPRGPARAG